MANRELREVGTEPDKPKILLTAPTGTAAFNINGCTIHSALQLPTKMDDTYQKLSDSTCNRLRVQLAYLKILIIDEISMVSSGVFNYVDKRLQQIKDLTQPFGGITVVAVGDLYQLRPVGKYVFELSSNIMLRFAGSVWQSNFYLIELRQIMRQKDDSAFAALLNRIRKGQQTMDDIKILQDRGVNSSDQNYNRKALHIYATNIQTDEHNNDRLTELAKPIVQLTRREQKPVSLENYTVSDNPSHTGGLVKTLRLCVGARVMIIRNIDVQDGLVNGAQGQIIDFLPSLDNVQAILVKFDKPNIGQTARNASTLNLNIYEKNVVPISRIDVQFSTSFKRTGLTITWTQFPLKLAFACTIHKVQGLSVDELVVSFKKKFSGGQAYVALSRCRTIQGLQILDFDPQKILQNSSVKREMARLQENVRLPSPYIFLYNPLSCRVWTISLLNARSLRLHFNDVLKDPITKSSDLLMYTETNTYNHQANMMNILDYKQEIVPKDTDKKRHGLACYWRNTISCARKLAFEGQNIEILQMDFKDFMIILLYRSPSLPLSLFMSDLKDLFSSLDVYQQRTIILGDFNVDALGDNYTQLSELMGRHNFTNINSVKTHIQGSCLDHVYLSSDLLTTYHACYAHPSYYSDHFHVTLQLQRSQWI
ncbi:hypothetical protein FSP39_020499 [Pinctada imbricata]|uniref:ATP-dependent DNA helicase n=1 Tax=Pinctada imbricata TaxID=66713 RepID=A0AA88XDI8_PINIB|nr:hypothetical protein FSP39_020499 [Pinctada imbricata]